MAKNLNDVLASGEFEGVPFKVTGSGKDVEPGDTYLAERNVGVKLLTCKLNDLNIGCIFPEEKAYPYDACECVRIELLM